MDYNYNRIVLEQYLESLFKYILKKYNSNELKKLFNDLIDGKESSLLNKNIQNELNKYSKNTIRLIIEKKVLFALENSVVSVKKTYWKVLEDRCPQINRILLSHYYDKYIDLLKNNQVIYNAETIQDLNKKYNEEINKSMILNRDFENIVKNTSNISLNHMENLNTNGRTISIGDKKKGGIFLCRESNIEYGNFINKEEFINKIKENKNYKLIDKNGKISVEELEKIVNNLNQKIEIVKNEKIKNQDSRIIIDGSSNKKTGNIFLGNKTVELPNGEYVNSEELSLAIRKYMFEKNRKIKKQKIIKTKGVFKKVVAAATLAISLLTTSVSATSKENVQEISSEYKHNDFQTNTNKNIINTIENNQNLNIEGNQNVETVQNDNNNIENEILEEEKGDAGLEKSISEPINEVDISTEKNNLEENYSEDNNVENETLEEEKEDTELMNSNIELENQNIEPTNNIDVSTEENTYEKSELTNVNGNDIADYALQFVGNAYLYGGTNLTEGTDCSGFTQSVYSNFGIDIPRNSSSQMNSGTNIGTELENAIPGDLLCFNGHVGIYIGNGQMVHAASSKRGIVVNEVNYDKNKPLKAIIRLDNIVQKDENIAKTR